ncbi:MAG TPA: sulfatase-like hydrolase/transferase, partial [Anaerolineales bacterium]|nr:sulfatase-like hydrolase/transferase [Anaerolineales bacterium]
MKKGLNRRDFLKLTSLLPFAYYAPPSTPPADDHSLPNILVFVFDAFSGRNTPFAGYPRNTLPLTEKLAERATVYHNHFAGSNFTTPGTGTLLTGTYPWTHRAFKPGNSVIKDFQNKNLFGLLDNYHRISYTHNPLVSAIQEKFQDDIDLLKPRQELAFGLNKGILDLFPNDQEVALLSWLRNFNIQDSGTTYSLILRFLYQYLGQKQSEDFPRGIPYMENNINFYLEDAIDWTLSTLKEAPTPFLGYFHYYPPHDPYHTRADFIDSFKDVPVPKLKKSDKFARFFRDNRTKTTEELEILRRYYDEFIRYADYEFSRLYNGLEQNGLLENTWVIFTSDHGELFERAKTGHMIRLLYMPLVHIPLLVFAPGQQERRDIFTATSATDILPSILHLTGKPIPEWIEGQMLPQFSSTTADPNRSIFTLDGRGTKFGYPLDQYTGTIQKGNFKLNYYHNYDWITDINRHYELFNYVEDPEELEDLSNTHPDIATELLDELR